MQTGKPLFLWFGITGRFKIGTAEMHTLCITNAKSWSYWMKPCPLQVNNKTSTGPTEPRFYIQIHFRICKCVNLILSGFSPMQEHSPSGARRLYVESEFCCATFQPRLERNLAKCALRSFPEIRMHVVLKTSGQTKKHLCRWLKWLSTQVSGGLGL